MPLVTLVMLHPWNLFQLGIAEHVFLSFLDQSHHQFGIMNVAWFVGDIRNGPKKTVQICGFQQQNNNDFSTTVDVGWQNPPKKPCNLWCIPNPNINTPIPVAPWSQSKKCVAFRLLQLLFHDLRDLVKIHHKSTKKCRETSGIEPSIEPRKTETFFATFGISLALEMQSPMIFGISATIQWLSAEQI